MRSRIHDMNLDQLREEYRTAKPFPFFKIDNFLDDQAARQVVQSYPDYDAARAMGREFNAMSERLKVQVTDAAKFPPAVKALSDELSSPEFLEKLEYVTGIPRLVNDELLIGGGMHITGSGGRLDVHVDFNLVEDRQLHRRLNILVYLNDPWQPSWGGNIELWDEEVRNCVQSFQPVFNRCVVFETTDKSYHGVTPVTSPEGVLRRSFAAYYYTREAPEGWDGKRHSTVFRARPDEVVRGTLLIPAQRAQSVVRRAASKIKKTVTRVLS